MYLHLGNNHVVSMREIIAMINITAPVNKSLADFIEKTRKEKKQIIVSEKEKENSMIICDDKIYISPISANTLHKRGRIANSIAQK